MILRPLLMSTEMVKADRADRKNQTRRTGGLDRINEQPDIWQFIGLKWDNCTAYAVFAYNWEEIEIKTPYGIPGDRLWIRETWAVAHIYDNVKPIMLDPDECHQRWYAGDGVEKHYRFGKTRASIHMPREFSRTTVEITDLRIQRLQDISEADAIAEGIQQVNLDSDAKPEYKDYLEGSPLYRIGQSKEWGLSPIGSYITLFQSINGKELTVKNPWSWAITYKHL
jgi:hypothetical protein